MTADDYCYVTTIGRRSGTPHRIEIWYVRTAETLYLLAGGGHRSDWVRNLVDNPAVTVEVDGATHPAIGRLVEDEDEQVVARRLVFEKYQSRYAGDLTSWRETSLPVALELKTFDP